MDLRPISREAARRHHSADHPLGVSISHLGDVVARRSWEIHRQEGDLPGTTKGKSPTGKLTRPKARAPLPLFHSEGEAMHSGSVPLSLRESGEMRFHQGPQAPKSL
jgi:hypothetical protein